MIGKTSWKPVRNALCTTLASLSIAACSGYSCREPQVYQSARSVPPLDVPDDLSTPEDKRLVIPRAAEEAPQRDPEDPCLDQPPDFFEDAEELS